MEGLLKACEKRPVETRAIEAIVDDVEAMLSERVDREVRAQEVGAFVMGRLQELDKVAYVRFASVYKDFQDPEEFVKEIHGILSDRKAAQANDRADSRKKTTRRTPKSKNPGEP
jgi:transcriptional repressor NrdR